MKKKLILGLTLVGLIVASCAKKEVQPVISLNGEYEMVISLGGTYVESGATAMDNRDGDISENIIISGGVDVDQTGEYRIFYDVADEEGNNAATATRFVKVVNDADFMIGTYAASPSCSGTGTIADYNTTITASTTQNNKIFIRRVLFTVEDSPVIGFISESTITIPLQTIGDHSIEGSATLIGSNFQLNVMYDGEFVSCSIDHVRL